MKCVIYKAENIIFYLSRVMGHCEVSITMLYATVLMKNTAKDQSMKYLQIL